ncbi:hypothetical protein [Pedobacter sp. Leaf250]|uniref:hypothetical protein n=1 Tax=Pedobacter sp. Leaf250 TaxID=2876559 RepID=UPI001E37F2B0|nr:hypothetical protein [Pedobacter sp. Leaf250]
MRFIQNYYFKWIFVYLTAKGAKFFAKNAKLGLGFQGFTTEYTEFSQSTTELSGYLPFLYYFASTIKPLFPSF